MQKAVFIVGPTAVGKTALAVELAQKYSGSLVSADSVQVYKGLDIISGKDLPEAKSNGNNAGFYTCWGINIFLLDVVEPTSSFSVSNFYHLAIEAIEKIHKENNIPIVVGGTGLYIKSLIEDIETFDIKPDLKLRKKLESLDIAQLQNMIPKEFVEQMNDSDRSNKRRLIRKIEIFSSQPHTARSKIKKHFESLVMGLYCEKDVLKRRIDERVEYRLKNGALKEAEGLFKKYENLCQQVKDANGYKQLFQFLKKEIDFEEAIYRWKISEYQHAKNQMTWFRKYGDVKWFDIAKKGFKKDIEISLKKFLK